ncbi:MAG TPA: hypothetical protein VMD53_08000 [Rhizomicrobium sp.]|nr:hypothetical protein [Rhizomicrobium sp.]
MAVRFMLLILGAFHLLNGLAMLAAPLAWYHAVPGVSATGPLNHHFIVDIGLVFVASSAGLILGARRGQRAAVWAAAGAAWPALHALFHIWGWFAHGVPMTGPLIASDVFGVVGIGALGVALAFARNRQEGVLP